MSNENKIVNYLFIALFIETVAIAFIHNTFIEAFLIVFRPYSTSVFGENCS